MKTIDTEENNYLRAKKKVDNIKGFYIHFAVFVLCMPIIIITNFMFVPGFNFFWLALVGWGLGIFFHWFGVFGINMVLFSKNWENGKIQELMNDDRKQQEE